MGPQRRQILLKKEGERKTERGRENAKSTAFQSGTIDGDLKGESKEGLARHVRHVLSRAAD